MLESVRIDPPPPAWPDLLAASHDDSTLLGRSLEQWRRLTRSELLGAEPARIVATGHQAGFWHPGILAKYHALDAAGAAMEADALVEIIADQDVGDLHIVRVPVIDGEGILTERAVHWSQWPHEERGGPTGAQPPMLVDPHAWRLDEAERFALPGLENRCRVMGQALMLMRRAASRAEQACLAAALLRDARFENRAMPLASPARGGSEAPRFLIPASSLVSTTLWGALIDHLRADPGAAWTTYNRAAAAVPDAGIAPLERRVSGGFEIPCWLVTPDGVRHRAFEHDLRRGDARLWPRALLMTGFVRLALCDLFIHGAGGFAYDRVTEAWLGDWLGAGLAPKALVTATMTLDFDREAATERDLARAKWVAHHLPFNLDRFLDDPGPRRQREAALREIEALPRRSEARREAFERMRAMQRDLARRHERILDEAQRTVRLTARRLSERALMNDRAWAFPLHPPAALAELRGRIAERFERVP